MPRLNRFIHVMWLITLGFAQAQENIVEDIKIAGNSRVGNDAIIYRISTKPGDRFNPGQITLDLRALWQTGLFENVGVTESAGTTGKILTFVVKELPIVLEIDYRGNKRVTKSAITDKIEEEHLEIPEDSPLDYRKVNAVRALIKRLMDEKGLRYGTVDYKLEPLEAGTARLVFNISEGGKVRIHEVEFAGNEVFSDRKLRRIMKKTKEHWMFSWLTQHDIYRKDKFAEDVDEIKERYWRKGYKDIYVGEPAIEVTDHTSEKRRRKNIERAKRLRSIREDKRMKLTIPLFEGRSYSLGGFTVEGNTVIQEAYYKESFPLKEGALYDLGKINTWIDDLEELHNNAGYVHYNVEQNVVVRDGDVVDVNFKVKENDQVYVKRIGFKGNTTTRDKVLRREVLLREGDVFRLNFFRNSLLRLNQLGFFEVNQDPDIAFLPDENKVNLTIKGQESGVNELNFGLGFNEVQGTSAFLSFSTLNFLGKGERLAVQAQLGSITDQFDVTFTEPWLFDKPRGLTARVFNTRSSFSAAGFEVERTGFQLGLSFRPSVFTTYSIGYSFALEKFPEITSPAFKPIDNLLTSSVTQGFLYNTTDHPFFPKRGRKGSISFELAGWQFGGDNYFLKTLVGGTQYLRAFKKSYLGFNVRGGQLNTLEGQRATSNNLFFLGGEESVRGYERQSLGPVVQDADGNAIAIRGDKLFQTNLEYIIPVSDQFRFVVFYDAGMIFGVNEDWFETDLARSTGLEMRFSLPIFQAPLRLIYAWVLDDVPRNQKGGDLKFSIGTTF